MSTLVSDGNRVFKSTYQVEIFPGRYSITTAFELTDDDVYVLGYLIKSIAVFVSPIGGVDVTVGSNLIG